MSFVPLNLDCMDVTVIFFLLLPYYCLSATYILNAGVSWGTSLSWKALETLFTQLLNKHVFLAVSQTGAVVPNDY